MTNEETELDKAIKAARLVRGQREAFEDALDKCKRQSRAVAIELIFEHQLPLARVSAITGHMRPTLRVWVESELAKRSDDGMTSPTVKEF